ncbi:MAG: transporter substrate-binding domain-containing protein [Flavobacteriales bacterium]|nr:transporter substrate-binding domain-containing protein [Flavobacteriales bacterium]
MKKRYLFGLAAAGVVGVAVLVLKPDLSGEVIGTTALVDRDLEEIQRDTLRVLVLNHHLTYEKLRKGETGLEFELVKRMAHAMGVPLKAVVVAQPDSLIPLLYRGAGDVIAAQLPRDNPFHERILLTVPYRYVSPVLATRREDTKADDGTDTDTAWVSAWSPFAPAEHRFPGMDVEDAPGERTLFTDTSRYADHAVINVALGRVPAALLSDASAAYFAERFPHLRFSEPLDASVPLVFGLRPNARDLQRALDVRLRDPQEREAMSVLMGAYGASVREVVELPCASTRPVELSAQGALSATDRRLLASIIYHGPVSTAIEPWNGDTTTSDGSAQVSAIVRYLDELDAIWARRIPDHEQRTRFVVASYLVGPGHVEDACALATDLGLDGQRWDNHVERAILLLALPRYFSSPLAKHGLCDGSSVYLRVQDMMCQFARLRTALP